MLASLLASVIVTTSAGHAPSMVSAGLACARAEFGGARASLAIDTTELREAGAGPAVARQLRGRASALLRRASIVPDGGAWDSVIAIAVTPLGGSSIGYQSSISLEKGARGYPSEHVELRCDLCTEGELVAQLLGALDLLVPEIQTSAGSDQLFSSGAGPG